MESLAIILCAASFLFIAPRLSAGGFVYISGAVVAVGIYAAAIVNVFAPIIAAVSAALAIG